MIDNKTYRTGSRNTVASKSKVFMRIYTVLTRARRSLTEKREGLGRAICISKSVNL